jgi:hypothetical protein
MRQSFWQELLAIAIAKKKKNPKKPTAKFNYLRQC